jgi:hypothetical protein
MAYIKLVDQAATTIIGFREEEKILLQGNIYIERNEAMQK